MRKDANKYPLTRKGCREEIDRLRGLVQTLTGERDSLEVLYKQLRGQVKESLNPRKK